MPQTLKSSFTIRQRARKLAQVALLSACVIALMGAGDPMSRFNDLGHQLMCICGCNQILLECNHVGCPNSDEMRNELMAGVQRGDSDSLVEQSFVQKYGPTVLAAPPTTGLVNRAVWLVPFIALLLGVGVVVVVITGWRKGSPPSDPPSSLTSGGGAKPNSPASGASSKISPAELERFRDQARRETEI